MERLDPRRLRLPGVETRVVARCRSTNSALLAENAAGRVLLAAEEQTAGRGRRGRRWHSERGSSLAFSLAVPLARPLRELPALSLIAGLVLTRVLRRMGVKCVALKWPNDLVVRGAKLGGILIETRRSGALTRVVLGVGLNCRRALRLDARLRRRIAYLDDYTRVDRTAVLRTCAAALLEALERFEQRGFAPFAGEWQRFDGIRSGRTRAAALA